MQSQTDGKDFTLSPVNPRGPRMPTLPRIPWCAKKQLYPLNSTNAHLALD